MAGHHRWSDIKRKIEGEKMPSTAPARERRLPIDEDNLLELAALAHKAQRVLKLSGPERETTLEPAAALFSHDVPGLVRALRDDGLLTVEVEE
jgi:hypothetical protein